MKVGVLFCRGDSNYRTIAHADVWDEKRDATRWPGGTPVIAHPPCRAWGRLRKFANPRPGEMDLARWAVGQVQRWGGVLEHPAYSTLWMDQGLPLPEMGCDEYGGWTLPVVQMWWGHRAEKKTWLYIVGCKAEALPLMPMRLGEATHVIYTGRCCSKPGVTKAEREHTPLDFARWLMLIAQRCEI